MIAWVVSNPSQLFGEMVFYHDLKSLPVNKVHLLSICSRLKNNTLSKLAMEKIFTRIATNENDLWGVIAAGFNNLGQGVTLSTDEFDAVIKLIISHIEQLL